MKTMKPMIRLTVLFLMLSFNLWAVNSSSPWYTEEKGKGLVINVELYLSSTCPHCHKADEFFKEIEKHYPWLHVERYIIDKDKNALKRFGDLLTELNRYDFAVPSIFFCNSRWVGFATAQTTGKDLLKGIEYCKEEIVKNGTLTAATESVLNRWGNANLFDSNITGSPSTNTFIFVVALIDAISPCALFTIAAFFGLLFMIEKRKLQFISGSLFILTVGGVHYFQQVYPTLFFESLSWFRIPAALVGLFAFYFAGQYYKKRSIQPLFIVLAFLLAFTVPMFQQTCLMNWSYVFEQWLHNQNVSGVQMALYQFAYQLIYILPLIILMFLYWVLMKIRFFEKLKAKLPTIGFLYILAISLLLIIYPYALSNLALSLFLIVSLGISGLLLNWFNASKMT
ncbi:TPA: hypothetical protein I8Y81_001961 [Legionella pneumophila]|nr:hypothetical protein [Legionella pneumophila]